jgi:hypothetical protein
MIQPTTLGNMLSDGLRTLAVYCAALWCNHDAVFDMSDNPDDASVPAFGPRMVCTVCGANRCGCLTELE